MKTQSYSQDLLWVRYEARPMLLDTMALSPLAELAHRRLCDSIWATGELPLGAGDAPRRLSRLTSRQWERVWKELQAFGWRCSSGRLSHPWPLRLLKDAQAMRRRYQAMGAVGGRRAHKKNSPDAPAPASAPAKNAAQAKLKPGSTAPQAQLNPGSSAPQITVEPSSSQAQVRLDTVTIPVPVPSPLPVLTALNAERLTFSVSARAKLSRREGAFMGAVRELFTACNPDLGRKELENWGGWWRNRFRENPDKAQRVLADIGSMLKEGTVHTNPGAAATDLWSRLP